MAGFSKLTTREGEVLDLLLQGRGNKQIAASLHISVRTVEFHLKNIYAKLGVRSRVELIVSLGNATGTAQAEKLGRSTVEPNSEIANNRDGHHPQVSWAASPRNTVSEVGKELEMKNLLGSKHVGAGVLAAFFTGGLWVSALRYSHWIGPDDLELWGAPLIFILALIGLSVGLAGKRCGNTLRRVCLSTLFGTGVSPFLIIPLMIVVVLPLGKVAEWLGLVDPSTMPNHVASVLTAIIMLAIWLLLGITIGVGSLFITFLKPEQAGVQSVQ